MMGALMLVRRQSFALARRDILPLVVLGLLFSFSSLLLFQSYKYMDAGIASTILFLYPVVVAVIMTVGFHEKASLATVLSILLSSVGILLLCRSADGTTLNPCRDSARTAFVVVLCRLYRRCQPLLPANDVG